MTFHSKANEASAEPPTTTRRQMLERVGLGFGGIALADLFGTVNLPAAESVAGADALLQHYHVKPRAKRVIYLFQSGGPSQVDLLDPKPLLNEMNGENLPESVRRGQRLTTMSANQARFPLAGSVFKFRRAGESGLPMSELLPYTAGVADDLCVINSVHTEAINHDPAITFFQTGSQVAGRPSMGSWLSYGLGTDNENLPRFCVLISQNTGGQPLIVSSSVTMHAICIDRTTGKVLHDIEILKVKNPQWIHHLNSYASPSPILEDGRLYCAFGTYGTVCLDTKSAKVVWTNDELNIMHENGPGSTPVLSGDHLIMHCDGSDAQYVAALDKNTGKLAWKTARSGKMHGNPQLKKSYATPLVVKIGGRSQVISPGADWLYSYDPASGKELWKVPYGKLGFSIVPRPVVGHGMIFMCTSYMQSELLAIRYDTDKPAIAWRFKKQVPNRPSPVLVGDEIYMVSDKGVANCLNAKTGESHWTKRLGGGYSSSPLYADGKLFFLDQDGKTTVIKPGTKYEQLAVNQLADRIMASPAAVGSALYLRTEKSLYRIEK